MTSIIVAIAYYRESHYELFRLTLAIIIAPMVMQSLVAQAVGEGWFAGLMALLGAKPLLDAYNASTDRVNRNMKVALSLAHAPVLSY